MTPAPLASSVLAHNLSDLRKDGYRAKVLEAALRGLLAYPGPSLATRARDLLAEIEAARTLSPEIISYDHPPPLPFEAEVLGEGVS